MCAVIAPKYGRTTWIFGIIGAMAKTLYGYWNGLVGVAGPNVPGGSFHTKSTKKKSSLSQISLKIGTHVGSIGKPHQTKI